jgi:hypothetical protein
MNGLLLRIGIDRGTGGCLAPIYEDRSFEFIPIPEYRATSESRVYANMVGRTSKRIVDFVPEKIKFSHPHYDPEFDTFTYGDPTKTKRNQLSKLSPGDILIFYVGLRPIDGKDKSQLFVIGYFDIEEVYDFKKIQKSDYDSVFKKFPNNAHSKIYLRLKELKVEYSDNNLIIVKGKSKSSRLFTKALPIGDYKGNMLEELEDIFGYKGSLQRAVGHWIKDEYILKTKKWLGIDEDKISSAQDYNTA